MEKYSFTVNIKLHFGKGMVSKTRWNMCSPMFHGSRSTLLKFIISATVCINMFEPESTFCFIPVQPVQRINSICAHSSLNIEISSISETVCIAIPIPLKVS